MINRSVTPLGLLSPANACKSVQHKPRQYRQFSLHALEITILLMPGRVVPTQARKASALLSRMVPGRGGFLAAGVPVAGFLTFIIQVLGIRSERAVDRVGPGPVNIWSGPPWI